MKLARNLFLALALLVLLYGGVYRFVFRERVRDTMLRADPFDPESDALGYKLFAPAAELDLRLTFDRSLRNRLRGHWIDTDTGDFVTLSGNDACTFQLGEFQYSGQVNLDRQTGRYHVEFQSGGLRRYFGIMEYTPMFSDNSRGSVLAWIGTRNGTGSEKEDYDITLTRAPSPAP